ncbi:Bile salt sulfotransferase [Sciurus carolinensis]|uniref:Sulfotransferase n=1 Tax=Sciurus carolinensis TaxID=30640 RepID=A0AA41MQS2_SCICA|nr:Bile salt sulfotransferase [Sciurus carolinensis]
MEILCQIHSKGDTKWIQSVPIWEHSPVLYIMRNPKDVPVSCYYFWTTSKLSKKPESLEQCFKWFIQGNVPYGSWFELIRGWMSMRDRETFLLLSYEELQKGPRSTIEKICQFLGKKLNPEELDSVLENSSFHVMKQNQTSNFEILPETLITKHFSMTRKGICGDWKNHFTVAQAEAFNKVFQEKMVLYIMRNPKDVLVSGYYFWSTSTLSKKIESREQYFKWFIQGNVPYGSWFEHIRGWMSMRDRKNFLLLSYEELQKDPRSTIEKICQFLGKKLNPEELDSVLKNSSFHVMKQNKMSNFKILPETLISKHFSLTRKGICGDWKNHFTVAQAEAFHKVYQEKMADLPKDLFPWE